MAGGCGPVSALWRNVRHSTPPLPPRALPYRRLSRNPLEAIGVHSRRANADPWMAPLAVLGLISKIASPRKRPCSAPGRRSGRGSLCTALSRGRCCADRVDGLDGALLLAGDVGSLVSQGWETGALRCTHPRDGLFGDIESWWAWRDQLDRVQDPNIATLKREADCEIARILRCCEARWEPKRPARLVPGRGGDREPGLMDEAGQPLGRASPDDESGLERVSQFPQPSAGTRCADAVNHSFIASVQASQWGGVAYSPAIGPALSDHVRAGPFAGGLRWRARRAVSR